MVSLTREMVSLTREGDREYVWPRARSQPRSATTAGYFPFATCARRGLRKGTAGAVRGHDRDSGRDRDAPDGRGAPLPDGESAPLDRPDPAPAGQHGRAPGR